MKNKTPVFPTKKTINLCVKERSPFTPVKLVPLLLVVLILAVLFGKFAVADRYAAMNAAENRVEQLQQAQDKLLTSTADYDKTLEEYNRYSTSWMTQDEFLAIKRTDMLDLIEKEFIPVCDVLNVTAAGNVLSLQLGGITLDDASSFVKTLYARDDVTNVSVYTASTQEGSGGAKVQMVITMTQPDQGGIEQ